MSRLRDLADEYWQLTLETAPTLATLLGDHRYDDRIEDLSAEAEAALRTRLVALRRQVEAVHTADLARTERVSKAMLLAEIGSAIDRIDTRIVEISCDQMTGPHAELLQVIPQLTLPEPEHAEAILERYRKVGEFLDQALARFQEGSAAGRNPAACAVERSISQLDGYLASPVDSDLFLAVQLPSGWDGEARWRSHATSVIAEVIRPAFLRYRNALHDQVLPQARPEDRAGLCWIDGGDEIYSTLIRIHTSLPLTAAEIHRRGRDEIEKRLPSEYATVAERALGIDELGPIFDRLRSDPGLRYRDAGQIRTKAEATLQRARAAIGDWFGILPEADCTIQEVPDFLAADAPPAYYFPPADDRSRPGTYFVNTHEPENQNLFEAESIGFHEAIPGHHLQIAIASELEGLPDFQRHSFTTAYVEGWGLYAERLADEMGLYSSDIDRLGMLSADSWRAGRLVVDTGLHAMGWSRQEAIDYLDDNSPVPHETILQETDRYIAMPAQALSYKIGQQEIFRLRELAREQLGERFSIKRFHDVVLASGGVTLPILRQLVEDWIRAAGDED
ncbi:MAG: hypothetical protein JJLCMIEE_03055 [Acidimicrobiales bacterium]|nr:MAG: DUF885 domain-containing protein [Actinomycetota bacterium]MBV6509939.1 hypothetical protein [Acidimicrobiales bacterium]RIK08622.1 MAG: DUF885 domain-containing protein [Acidobacteriota bacterium]